MGKAPLVKLRGAVLPFFLFPCMYISSLCACMCLYRNLDWSRMARPYSYVYTSRYTSIIYDLYFYSARKELAMPISQGRTGYADWSEYNL